MAFPASVDFRFRGNVEVWKRCVHTVALKGRARRPGKPVPRAPWAGLRQFSCVVGGAQRHGQLNCE
jgi:hypothetical protein